MGRQPKRKAAGWLIFHSIRGEIHGVWGKQSADVSPDGWHLRGFWKTVDRLYVWSAAVVLFVAIVLIALGLAMQMRNMHIGPH